MVATGRRAVLAAAAVRRATAACAGTGAGRGADMVTQLKELAELKSQGILTDAEFDAQKAKILAAS